MRRATPIPLYNIQTNTHIENQLMWSTYMYDEEYIEVEILTDKTEQNCLEEKNIDVLNANKYKCHICNIKVPKTYAKEHNNSAKHKTCSEITNIALERTRLQIQLDVAVNRKVEVLDTYFCEPCAAVLLNSDKETHKATKLHKISVKHDKLLSELLKVYEDIENIDSEVDELELVKQSIEQDTINANEEADLEATDKITANNNNDSTEISEIFTETTKAIDEQSNDVKQKKKASKKKSKQSIEQNTFNASQKADLGATDKITGTNNTNDSAETSKIFLETINNQSKYVKLKKKASKKKSKAKKTKANASPSLWDLQLEKLKNPNPETNKSDVELEAGLIKDVSDILSLREQTVANVDNFIDMMSKRLDQFEAELLKHYNSNSTVDAINNNSEEAQNKNETGNEENIQNINSLTEDKHTDNENERSIQEIKEPICVVNKDTTLNTENNNNNIVNKKETEKKSKIPEENKKGPEQKKDLKQKINSEKNKEPGKQVIGKKQSTRSKPAKSNAPSFNLLCYIKDITRRCETKPIHTVEAMTDNVVQITAINRDKFKVLVNNFHSFHVKSNEIHCKICDNPKVRRQEWHIAESQHREKVMIPIEDLNGIRQLDDIWSHCILCNDLTTNVDFHLQSLHHQNKIKQTLVELGEDAEENTKKIIKPKPVKNNAAITELMVTNNLAMTSKGCLNCWICDLMVDYNLESVQQHVNSFHHLDKFEISTAMNDLINMDNDMYYCVACDLRLMKMNVISHCNGKKHEKLLAEFFIKGKSEAETDEIVVFSSISQNVKKSKDILVDFELICFVCNIVIASSNGHTDTFEHKKNYLSYLESNKLNEIEPDTFYCIPCNTVIGIDYLMSHCMSKKHKRILKCFLCCKTGHNTGCNTCNKQDQGNKNDNSSKQDHQSCVCCIRNKNEDEANICNEEKERDNNLTIGDQDNNCDIRNQEEDQDNNCNKQKGQNNNYDKQKDQNNCNCKEEFQINNSNEKEYNIETVRVFEPTTSQSLENVYNVALPLKILYQFQTLKSPNNLLCTVCDEEVLYTRKQTTYHVSTLDHVVAFNLMMLWNKIKKRADKYFCDICKSDITYFSEINHVLGKEHVENLARQPKGTVYEYDSALVTHAYAMSHKVGDRMRPSPVVSVKTIL